MTGQLERRKAIIENKLSSYGIDSKITHLPYLEFYADEFQPSYEVGCRILVLFGVSYSANYPNEKVEIKNWLKDVNLWDKVSENEKKVFSEDVSEKTLIGFSWNIEAVIVLCWAVNLLDALPKLDTKISDSELDKLMEKLPINTTPDEFLKTLSYRNKEDIFIENIFNEMITWYLRDGAFSQKKESFKLDRVTSYERHYALNWLRKFSGISEWDETDTST